MELVYLWVEGYKNIKRQGFNFSPRFHCEYDEKENKLTINENDDYIPDFFGENINITAIVGKNGSGKSSVLECLTLAINSFLLNNDDIFRDNNPNFNKYILIYKKEKQYFNLGNIKIKYNNLFNRDENYYAIENHINQNHLYTYQENENLLELVLRTFYTLNSKYITFFKPDRIIVDFFNCINDSLDQDFENLSLKDKIKNIINFKFKSIQDKHISTIGKKNISIEKYLRVLKKENGNDWTYFDKNWSYFDEDIAKLENLIYIQKFINENTLNNLISNSNHKLFYMISTPINSKVKSFLLALNKLKILNIYDSRYSEINNETYKDFGISFYSLSEGEQSFLNILLDIIYQLENLNNTNLTIFIDEPENNLHPEWQKSFISELMKNLKIFEININILITSHSPFLLSDIPKQNIIFLDKDEKGNCKVVDGLKEKKETFGANIHTLLSDSFFMEDGLMGEFAKSKIDDVINYLHDRESKIKSDDEAQKLIHIIGEPIVKNQLQRMLDSRRLKKVDRIDAIEKDIKALTEKLARLKND